MENQEILILKKIKSRRENPIQKIDKNKKGRGQAKVKINSTILTREKIEKLKEYKKYQMLNKKFNVLVLFFYRKLS